MTTHLRICFGPISKQRNQCRSCSSGKTAMSFPAHKSSAASRNFTSSVCRQKIHQQKPPTTEFPQQTKQSGAELPQVDGKILSPEEAKAEAAKLAMNSLKDMGSLFSSGSDDKEQPIDTAPVFKRPQLFAALSLLHQGQVLKELQKKYDESWTKLTDQDKKLGYYVSYGNWGVREKFSEWAEHKSPWDLPFTVPSKIRTTTPGPSDLIHKLEPVVLAETEVRKEQFDSRRMDPVTKTFIYLAALVVIVAVARDKRIGEEGRPVECIIEDEYAKTRAKQEEEARLEEAANRAHKQSRKWYFLWLK